MEEWSPQLITDNPCCMRLFLGALQQCIDVGVSTSCSETFIYSAALQHTVFMHRHRIAHLDISMHNLLTDGKGHYACIDYETSRQYDCLSPTPRISHHRATEVPPEFGRGECSDPFKVDVWALAVLMLRACQVRYHIVWRSL